METKPLPKKKRKVWPFVLGFFVVAFAISRWTSKDKPEQPVADNSINRDKALSAILKEPKVKDAAITEANVLYAQVVDDKTRRDGYAMYLCQVLNEHKADVFKVKVVAVGSQNSANRDNAYGRLLGECNCKDYSIPGK